MASFLAEVKTFNFWPKTMDYSQAFWSVYLGTIVIIINKLGRVGKCFTVVLSKASTTM